MSSRDPWLDNAKMTLVTLVVVGHSWTLVPESPMRDHVYDFLYSWHMPAFVFVTGYLSRGFTWSGPRLAHSVRTLVVPYLIFEAALTGFRTVVGGETLIDVFIDPTTFWYLVALVLWRLATPAFRALPGALVVAVAICLLGGLLSPEDGLYLDIARVTGFLPFYVLGVKTTPERLERLRHPSARVAAVVVLIIAFAQIRSLDMWASTGWLYYSCYETLGESGVHAMVVRLGILGIGLICSLAFLALVPRRSGWFSRMGSATLLVYLFHVFLVRLAFYEGVPDWAAAHPIVSPLVVVTTAVALALALASRPVAERLDLAVDPFGHAQLLLDDTIALTFAAASGPIDLSTYAARARDVVAVGGGGTCSP